MGKSYHATNFVNCMETVSVNSDIMTKNLKSLRIKTFGHNTCFHTIFETKTPLHEKYKSYEDH